MTLFVVDPTVPYPGYALGTMTAGRDDIPQHVDYQSELTTLQQFRDLKGNQNLQALTWEELSPMVDVHLASFQGSWTEITEEEYWDKLEMFPPQNWRKMAGRFEVFYIMEAITESLHEFCVQDYETKKYYAAVRSKFIPNDTLLAELNRIGQD